MADLGMALLVLGGVILGMTYVFADELYHKRRALAAMRKQVEAEDLHSNYNEK